ncbi:MAG TPA: hypothetical protein VGF70_04385 [Solirubrobacteraceae bacterium]|jgi:hypothetical protein
MSQRKLWWLVAILLLIAVPAFAQAQLLTGQATRRTHKVAFTTLSDAVKLSGPLGAPGTKERDAGIRTGTIDGRSVGTGAVVDSGTWGAGGTFRATGRSFDTRGTVAFKTVVTATPGPGGKLRLKGTITVISGTGAFKGIRGTLKVTGTAPLGSDDDADTLRATGTVTF